MVVCINVEYKYEKLAKMEQKLVRQHSRRNRLFTLRNAFQEILSYEEWDPILYGHILSLLTSYQITLQIQNNLKVDTALLELEVKDLFQDIKKNPKLSSCQHAYIQEYREQNEKKLWEIYDQLILLSRMKLSNGTRSRKYKNEFMPKVAQIYYTLVYLMDVLPVNEKNAYMFGNLCHFYKEGFVKDSNERENICAFLEKEEVKQYLKRK